MILYAKQSLDSKDIQAVVDVLKSNWLTQGPKISQFEQKFSQKVGSKYAVAVSNGTATLGISQFYPAMDDKEVDYVIDTIVKVSP